MIHFKLHIYTKLHIYVKLLHKMPQIIETERGFINSTMICDDYLIWKTHKHVDNILHIKHIYIVLYYANSVNIEELIDDLPYFRNLVTFSFTTPFNINTNILQEVLKYKHITFTIKAPNLTNNDVPTDIYKLHITLYNSYRVVYVSYSSPEFSYNDYESDEDSIDTIEYYTSQSNCINNISADIVCNLMDDFNST